MFNMYLSIKAFSNESFMKFYEVVGGSKKPISKSVVFDIVFFEQVQITFYSNLTILFKGEINTNLNSLIDIIIDDELYVGSDEVGVGESIGPIVAVALKFKNYNSKKLVIMNGIKDSKKLSADEIFKKSDFIKKHSEYFVVSMVPSKFNEVYKKLPNVKAINALMQNELHKKFEGMGYKHITDQFVNERKYNEYISESKNEAFKGKLMLLTKAEEKYLEVSAAAIIAKSIFNNWVIEELKKEGISLKIGKRLNSWNIFLDIKNDKLKVKDKNKYIKNWSK